MGIDTQASIFVGLPREEIERGDELIEAEDLEVCPPCYDGNSERHAIAGFSLFTSECYCAVEIEWDAAEVERLKVKFKALTGQDAKVYLSPNVW
jgi:hypothetical protein